MKHQKHNKLARPDLGQWGRQEWAILGTVCSNIQALARSLGSHLSARWKTGYVDADHKSADEASADLPFALEWTDKIGYQRLETAHTPNQWERRARLNALDLVLLNGNHFEGRRQILALDRRKFDSLARKTDRLIQVDLFLTRSGDPNFAGKAELPDFLKNHLPGWADIPELDLSDTAAIAVFLEKRLRIAPLKALILVGGKSTRMGTDKADLNYHGMPQWQFLRQMLQKNGLEVFVSCRDEQATDFRDAPVVTDTFTGLGPLGAILSAFRHDPDAAWLVLACDLPLFDEPTLRFLIEHRSASAPATAFRQAAALPGLPDSTSGDAGFPEPLVAIWEPKMYARMLQFLAQGANCPRKVLINSDTCLLDAPRPVALANANTPEERALILEKYLTPSATR